MNNVYSKRETIEAHTSKVLPLLEKHEVLAESRTSENYHQTYLSNIRAVNARRQPGIVHARLRSVGNPEVEKNEIVYARQIVIPNKDDAAVMRTCAELVLPIHHCAQKLGLQGVIDYNGIIFGAKPMVSFGGEYEVPRIEEVLELITTVDNLIGFYLR